MDVWNAFCSRGVEDILHLIDLLRTLPATSVPNETAFNQMKLIKTNRRQRLSNDHLNDCMVVKANSETVETFDPTPAIDNWMTCCKGPRKLYYSRKTKQEDKDKRQATEEIVIEDVEADSQETVKTPLLEEGSETMNEINEATTVDTEAERRGEEEDKESDFEEGYDSESDSELEQNEETNSLMMTNIICEIETE